MSQSMLVVEHERLAPEVCDPDCVVRERLEGITSWGNLQPRVDAACHACVACEQGSRFCGTRLSDEEKPGADTTLPTHHSNGTTRSQVTQKPVVEVVGAS